MKNTLISIIKCLNSLIRKLALYSHALQYKLQWGSEITPEWMDHHLDQYFLWNYKEGKAFWVERGVFNNVVLKRNGTLLELCCGDGFNTRHFFTSHAAKIIAVDFDPTAISHASKYNSHPKITHLIADIRTSMPEGRFDNIVWDAAIEHFTETEIAQILNNIKSRLKDDGILSGYTLVEREDGHKHLHQHEYEFKNKEDLYRFFTPHFKNVMVFETIYDERHNLYFYATNGQLPFQKGWAHSIMT